MVLIYFINATLVLCHEIDSAVHGEWELFHLPGGSSAFVTLHLVMVPVILYGLMQVVRGVPSGIWISLVVGVLGEAGAITHIVFLLLGDHRFASLLSVALIVAFALSSAVLTFAAILEVRKLSVPNSRG